MGEIMKTSEFDPPGRPARRSPAIDEVATVQQYRRRSRTFSQEATILRGVGNITFGTGPATAVSTPTEGVRI